MLNMSDLLIFKQNLAFCCKRDYMSDIGTNFFSNIKKMYMYCIIEGFIYKTSVDSQQYEWKIVTCRAEGL